jgi:zinc ribbon protein
VGPTFPQAGDGTGAGWLWLREPPNSLDRQFRPYNGAALASSQAPQAGDTAFCRECGKPIEADARFCRFCGKSQADPVSGAPATRGASTGSGRSASGSGESLESRLRQLFPRHHLQDEFMHISTIAAFFMALIGFVLGFFTPALGGSWLSTNFLLGAIALLLFLILRESTLSHIRGRSSATSASAEAGRYHAARRGSGGSDLPAEAATADSSPPPARRSPPTPK